MSAGSWLRSVAGAMFRRQRLDDELDEELRAHLQLRADELVRTGLALGEALRRARLEFGALDKASEECRGALGLHFLRTLLQDLRFGLRMLRKSPGFAAVAILTLALGIGANTAIFSAVNGILLLRPPYPDAPRLVEIVSEKFSGTGAGVGLIEILSTADARDIQAQCPGFEDVATYEWGQPYTLTGQLEPERLSATNVSGNFFSLAGVPPLLGRAILPRDATPGNSGVVVLGYRAWKDVLGGDPRWVDRKITLNGKSYAVIGVMPKEFDLGANGTRDIWLPRVPAPDDATDRASRFINVLARLKPGVSFGAAQAQLDILAARLSAAYPKTDGGWKFSLQRLGDLMDPGIKEGLLLLLYAAGFVLLIACVNVSGILLARGCDRQREVAVRQALGATRARMVRQFLSESLLLAVAGGGLGVLFGAWGMRVLRALAEPYTPDVASKVHLSLGVILFTAGVSVVAVILFGLLPALQVSASRIGAEMKENLAGSPGGFAGRRPRKLRNALVVIELALAVVLVTGASLVARGFGKLATTDLGFHAEHVLTAHLNFSPAVCDPTSAKAATQCRLATDDVLRRIISLPGVLEAAIASSLPGRGATIGFDFAIQGKKSKIGFSEGTPFLERAVSAAYFPAIGMRVLEGRGFAERGPEAEQPVCIVNESFAKKLLGDRPIGQRLRSEEGDKGTAPWMTVIGEVNDAHDMWVGTPAMPEVYIRYYSQPGDASMAPALIMRALGNPLALAQALKQQIWAVDKDAPVTDVTTLDQIVSDDLAEPRFQAVLLGSFGGLGLLLALIGIYGVISYSVAQRTHEIGVRMALGAQRRDVLRLVLSEGAMLAVAGIAIGLAGAFGVTRFLRSMLFEITAADPATFAGVSILLLIVALAACYIPARRAMRVDPMMALRHE